MYMRTCFYLRIIVSCNRSAYTFVMCKIKVTYLLTYLLTYSQLRKVTTSITQQAQRKAVIQSTTLALEVK